MGAQKILRLGDRRGLFGFAWLVTLVVALVSLSYGVYVHFVTQRQLATDFEIPLKDVKIAKVSVDEDTIYDIRSNNQPVDISWLVGNRSAGVKGKGFEINVEVDGNGGLKSYSLQRNGMVYVHKDGGVDADMRMSDSLDPCTREVRINGTWMKAPNNRVTIDGKVFAVSWENGWKLKPVEEQSGVKPQ